MATITREVLATNNAALTVFVAGSGNVGIGVSGTFVGTVSFFASTINDPLNFFAVGVIPFPSGTAVLTTTATGNWFTPSKNYAAIRIVLTWTNGSAQINVGVANDASWQDAFLTPTTINNSVTTTSGTLTLTQAAQANRAWNLTFLTASVAGPSWAGGTAKITIYDGTIAGSILFQEYIPESSVAGSVGREFKINLPTGPDGLTKLVNTPGNAMTITLTGLPNQSSILNAAFSAA